MSAPASSRFNDWRQTHPEITALRLAVADLNGVARGKRIPMDHAEKAFDGGMRMPVSALNVDIWGRDILDSPLVFASGDADGTLRPTERGAVPTPWLATPSALLPLWMDDAGSAPFAGDPRHALASVLQRYTARGLTPVVATEMEFYLLDGTSRTPQPPLSPLTGQRLRTADVLALGAIDAFDAFFTELYATCAAMGIPADAASSEAGVGQFEINLKHGPDALKAADDAWLFKLAARGVARKHGMAASFMAKPYADQPGNGLHMHFSLLDSQGRNAFDDATPEGSETMRHAVAGLLNAMPASTLIFAPHFNSYRRMTPDNHAPTSACWGYENRTTALRIPGGTFAARRIEHRVAGGDVNPYLMIAAILGAAIDGIERALTPPAPTSGNAYQAVSGPEAPSLITDWQQAIDTAASAPELRRIFPSELIDNLVLCKRQELATFLPPDAKTRPDPDFGAETYLETV